MGKIAFVFSGQGDQFPGMGKELCEKYPEAAKVFAMCDAIRPGTSEQCFSGTEEELRETKNTQPCLFVTELAAASVLTSHGISPEAVAGFSLGEVTACAFSGIVDNESGFRIVCKRGEIMQAEAEKTPTSMVAVVKLTADKVKELAAEYTQVYPVNFNCPGQVSVSGVSEQIASFSADVKNAGGRAIPLKVKGAFHSPFMNKAAELFAVELEKVSFSKGNCTMYSDYTAEPYGDDASKLLSAQICNPVRWEELIVNMINSGIDTFVEIGPGKTLTNMIKKINAEVKVYSSCEIDTVIAEVGQC